MRDTKKALIFAIILLIFGLSLAPVINANASQKDDFVNVDVEFYGLGIKQSVILSQSEYEEFEMFFDEIQYRLLNMKSEDEVITIFNEAIANLDKFDLLGVLSVKSAQNLITAPYQILSDNNLLNGKNKIKNLDSNENYFCLILAETTKTRVIRLFEIACSALLIPIYGFSLLSEIVFGSAYILNKIASTIISLNNAYQNIPNPIKSGIIGIGCRAELFPGGPMSNFSSEGYIWTQGLNGIKNWNGTIIGKIKNYSNLITSHRTDYIGITGFVGFKTSTYEKTQFIGYANRVKIENVNWA